VCVKFVNKRRKPLRQRDSVINSIVPKMCYV
jgi:hypothetical protein